MDLCYALCKECDGCSAIMAVRKEMPITRIVIAVPNTTVVLLD